MSSQPVGKAFSDPLSSTMKRRARPTTRKPVVQKPETTKTAPPTKPSDEKQETERTKPKSQPPAAKRPSKRAPDTIVYVTPSQAEAVRTLRQASGRSITQIVLAAVEETAPGLADAFTAAKAPVKGHMFQGSQAVPAPATGKVQLCLRLIESDRQALDALATEVKAPSRSHLVREALSETATLQNTSS
jgi:hypothetical protein